MRRLRGFALACHTAPTVGVTLIMTAFAWSLGWRGGDLALVALTVLVGQLSVGWCNDAHDSDLDARAGRAGKPTVAVFNRLHVAAGALGNHEFDFGPQIYLKRMGEARFPVLAANLRDDKGAMLPHHADTLMLERGGIRIGVVGATLDAGSGNVHLVAATDNITLGSVQTSASVEVTATAGSILDGNGSVLNVRAAGLKLFKIT